MLIINNIYSCIIFDRPFQTHIEPQTQAYLLNKNIISVKKINKNTAFLSDFVFFHTNNLTYCFTFNLIFSPIKTLKYFLTKVYKLAKNLIKIIDFKTLKYYINKLNITIYYKHIILILICLGYSF